jgi:hypothetical protein
MRENPPSSLAPFMSLISCLSLSKYTLQQSTIDHRHCRISFPFHFTTEIESNQLITIDTTVSIIFIFIYLRRCAAADVERPHFCLSLALIINTIFFSFSLLLMCVCICVLYRHFNQFSHCCWCCSAAVSLLRPCMAQ